MNDVCLMGRLTSEPELKQTTSGKQVCGFQIAVDRTFGEGADFFHVIAWGKTAEFCCNYFHKGNRVALTGRLQYRTWESNGQTRSTVEVVAEHVYFADDKRTAKPKEELPKKEEPEQQDFYASLNDDEVPF